MTGGATGIGAAICRRLAADGAAVVVADINVGRTVSSPPPRSTAGSFAAMPGMRRAWRHLANHVADRHPAIDIIVTAAAHLGGFHDAGTMPEAEWRAVMDVSLDGVYRTCHHLLPHAAETGRSRSSTSPRSRG